MHDATSPDYRVLLVGVYGAFVARFDVSQFDFAHLVNSLPMDLTIGPNGELDLA
jgi:hypothetical protein